ncbi:GGDEF domain-containing protein [Sphingomonas sp. BT-65]|uniref:GGDEF domain-containing protein n=1 Tax=Sphingomonas sp. BT-65 TaxID=2989821 RepID=UPI00223684DF|nr:GGDEF domain-containing protein [Sphingomonas sp. BT-65]MCW4460643.1 GGDEF domain-containing protein [Sphingomonas sp. BT-65]
MRGPHTAGHQRDDAGAAGDRIAGYFAVILPLLFVPAHLVTALASWNPVAWPPLLFETMAAFIACASSAWRASRSRGRARQGWLAVAAAMLCWMAGVGCQFLGSLTPAGTSGSGALSMLLFVLYGVPLTFVLASPGGDPWRARLVDGALALVLGALFGAFIFSFVALAGADEAGAMTLAWTFDIQNAFIAVFALVRFRASSIERERLLFGILTAYALVYMAVAGFYNHFVDDGTLGVLASPLVGMPFVLLAALALRDIRLASVPRRGRMFERVVVTGSPLILPIALLIVSAALVPRMPALAIAGCVAATLGYGLRAVLVQLHGLGERDQLAQLSQIDALTGLPNRRQFDEALRRELTRARRSGQGLALLMIDVDHFKLLNDTLGHRVGDERLRDIAATLQDCATRATDVVARYGGEEFVAILPGASPTEALMVAETMRATIEELDLASPAPDGRVTVSIGAARISDIETDTEHRLVERADRALYDSKRAGRNRVTAAWPVEEPPRALLG